MFINDLNRIKPKVDDIINNKNLINQAKLNEIKNYNRDLFYGQINFNELTRFFDMNFDQLVVFDTDTMNKIIDVYYCIINAKEFFTEQYQAKKCIEEMEKARNGIDIAIKSLI
jgi:hypothetical protein